MSLQSRIGLKDGEYQLFQKLVVAPLQKAGVNLWVFGSRARGDHNKKSDLDILYKNNKTPAPDHLLYEIKSNFEESNFPYILDLVNIDSVAESYLEDILNERIEIK